MSGYTLKQIALLRGINVNGHNVIKMTVLKQLFADLGFLNVVTYLQSGNVVFDSPETSCEGNQKKLEYHILKNLGLTVSVVILEKEKLISIKDSCPFMSAKYDQGAVYITFPASKINLNTLSDFMPPKAPGEEVVLTESAVYLYLPSGYGRSRLNNNFFENRLKTAATTRTLKTVNELVILAGQKEN